jgi:hypothetical protein
MSAEASTSLKDASKLKLQSADQYHLWLARITDLCWAYTKIDINTILDTDCEKKSAGRPSKGSPDEEEKNGSAQWVGRCWLLITTSLHDDVYLKVQHIKRGAIQSLMAEIRKSVLISSVEEVVPTRIKLYGATMEKEGGGDLQTFISYIKTKQNKLTALGDPLKETELVGIFLNSLSSLFHPIVVVLRGVPDALQNS